MYNTREQVNRDLHEGLMMVSEMVGNDYWRGRIWAPLNMLVYMGMKNYNADTGHGDETVN